MDGWAQIGIGGSSTRGADDVADVTPDTLVLTWPLEKADDATLDASALEVPGTTAAEENVEAEEATTRPCLRGSISASVALLRPLNTAAL